MDQKGWAGAAARPDVGVIGPQGVMGWLQFLEESQQLAVQPGGVQESEAGVDVTRASTEHHSGL